MGTNYYIKKAIRPSKIKELKELVNEQDIYNGTLQKALSEFVPIHIGKSSSGWMFQFNHNNWKYYNMSRQSINDFIKKSLDEGDYLVDEYNKDISLEEFWNIVDSHKSGFNSQTYYEIRFLNFCLNPEKYPDNLSELTNQLNYNPEIITEEGLCFNYFTEFC